MKAGELWSLMESGFRVGDGAVVREGALSQRWTVKPMTGVAREVKS